MFSVILYNVLLIFAVHEVRGKSIFVADDYVVRIGSRLYRRELLTSLYSGAKELAYDPLSRRLYFMHMDPLIQNSGRAFVNIDTMTHGKIDGIRYNKATAVDERTGDVYFGSENGLYKYDSGSNTAVDIGLYNINILKLVIRNGEMYLIDADDHMLYRVMDNATAVTKVGEWKTVMQFDVDNGKNCHFVNMSGVFCARNRYEVNKIDIDTVHHYIVEKDYALAINWDTIYKIDCDNGTAERIGQLYFAPSSIVLGNDGDIMYSIDDEIYLLRPMTHYYLYVIRRRSINKEHQ
ncbi:Ommochrome-binding protein [Eumeta japonica]|uniref:Ommochrome-binding protein n=1 Tax=Eumeta variegata TaxID=151549 RepID=A0A4C1VKF3_EUMVA|nr:Ommochrome-binding protein [Eumeta japonica]